MTVMPFPFAGLGEAPFDTAEARQRLADCLIRNADLVRDGNRSRSVERVMASGHRQHQIRDFVGGIGGAVTEFDLEFRTAGERFEIGKPDVGLRIPRHR